jgi:hypothetical protein
MGPMGLVGPMGPYGPIPCQTNAYIHIYIYMYIFVVNAKRTSGGQAIPGTHIYIYIWIHMEGTCTSAIVFSIQV